jgi:hypothetical protein
MPSANPVQNRVPFCPEGEAVPAPGACSAAAAATALSIEARIGVCCCARAGLPTSVMTTIRDMGLTCMFMWHSSWNASAVRDQECVEAVSKKAATTDSRLRRTTRDRRRFSRRHRSQAIGRRRHVCGDRQRVATRMSLLR